VNQSTQIHTMSKYASFFVGPSDVETSDSESDDDIHWDTPTPIATTIINDDEFSSFGVSGLYIPSNSSSPCTGSDDKSIVFNKMGNCMDPVAKRMVEINAMWQEMYPCEDIAIGLKTESKGEKSDDCVKPSFKVCEDIAIGLKTESKEEKNNDCLKPSFKVYAPKRQILLGNEQNSVCLTF
jgi:hypothetical protein